jgi:hypothetical protein
MIGIISLVFNYKTDLFGPDQLFIKYITASLLFWLMVYAGLVLLIVPGIYILLTYSFFGLEMVEKSLVPIDALKRSAEITKGAKRSLPRLGLEFCCGLFAINVVLFHPASLSFRILGCDNSIFAVNALGRFILHNARPYERGHGYRCSCGDVDRCSNRHSFLRPYLYIRLQDFEMTQYLTPQEEVDEALAGAGRLETVCSYCQNRIRLDARTFEPVQ